MNITENIKNLLQEAQVYKAQGLLNEAKNKYNKAVKIIESAKVKNKNTIIQGINKIINEITMDMKKLNKAAISPLVPERIQDLILKNFSFSNDKEAGALEGAIALAKFGQHERALEEFDELLYNDSLRVIAAKNIIRCHIAYTSVDEAVTQYQKWLSSNLFTNKQIDNVRFFLENVLEKSSLDKDLPVDNLSRSAKKSQQTEELNDVEILDDDSENGDSEVLDVSSIEIELEQGSKKGDPVELDVSFQSGNIISLIISKSNKDLINALHAGLKLNNIQFFSPMAIFEGKGVVASITKIESGPKNGDYSLDIKIIPK